MNNLYKRPMFRKGGSAEGGITSGLQRPRQGYALPGSVQKNDSSRQRIINACSHTAYRPMTTKI